MHLNIGSLIYIDIFAGVRLLQDLTCLHVLTSEVEDDRSKFAAVSAARGSHMRLDNQPRDIRPV
jgi:hypothetical protein